MGDRVAALPDVVLELDRAAFGRIHDHVQELRGGVPGLQGGEAPPERRVGGFGWQELRVCSKYGANRHFVSVDFEGRIIVEAPLSHSLPAKAMMSGFSSTGFGAPCFATSSIARPTSSVVVTYFGKSALKAGKSGPNTA